MFKCDKCGYKMTKLSKCSICDFKTKARRNNFFSSIARLIGALIGIIIIIWAVSTALGGKECLDATI